jgi:c-di-GMP-binding flagellar brake protein YcgR
MSIDHRRYVRLGLQLPMQFEIVGSHRVGQSQTRDFSPEGIRFTAEQSLPVGTQIEVTLQLPDRKDPVRFVGEVVWSEARLEEATAASDVGVRFVKISKRDQELLLHYGRLF